MAGIVSGLVAPCNLLFLGGLAGESDFANVPRQQLLTRLNQLLQLASHTQTALFTQCAKTKSLLLDLQQVFFLPTLQLHSGVNRPGGMVFAQLYLFYARDRSGQRLYLADKQYLKMV